VTTRVGVLQIAISNVVQDENGGVSSDAEMDGEDEDGDENKDEDGDGDEDEEPGTATVGGWEWMGVGGCMWVTRMDILRGIGGVLQQLCYTRLSCLFRVMTNAYLGGGFSIYDHLLAGW